jgi:methionyl-tRNA formyltransferase
MDLGLDVLTPEDAADEEFVEQIRELAPDVILVVAYGQILRQSLLDIPPRGCINAHGSILPRWRGASPLSAAIKAGDSWSGVTLIRMIRKLDAGPIITKRTIVLDKRETAGSLHDKLSELSAECLVGYLRADHPVREFPQDEVATTYAHRLEKGAGLIDWSQDAMQIDRHIRAMSPYPGAYTMLPDGKRLKVLEAEFDYNWAFNIPPGTIVVSGKNAIPGVLPTQEGIEVAASHGRIILLRVQASGGKAMNSASFAAGHKGLVGQRLDSIF